MSERKKVYLRAHKSATKRGGWVVKFERLWSAVKRWAEDNGKVYDPAGQVVGVAAT